MRVFLHFVLFMSKIIELNVKLFLWQMFTGNISPFWDDKKFEFIFYIYERWFYLSDLL